MVCILTCAEHPHLEHRTLPGLGCSALVPIGSDFSVQPILSFVGLCFLQRVHRNVSISTLGRQMQTTHGCLHWMSVQILSSQRWWDSFEGEGSLDPKLAGISSAQYGFQFPVGSTLNVAQIHSLFCPSLVFPKFTWHCLNGLQWSLLQTKCL